MFILLPSKFKGNINRININRVCVSVWPLKTMHNALGEKMYFQDGSGLKGSVRMSCIVGHK